MFVAQSASGTEHLNFTIIIQIVRLALEVCSNQAICNGSVLWSWVVGRGYQVVGRGSWVVGRY